jgi:membrane-associated PAP2 superfamily phosphatase
VENPYRRFVAINVAVLILSGLLFTWISRSGTIDFWLAQLFFDPVSRTFPLKNAPHLVFLGHTLLKYLTSSGLIVAIVLAVISSWVPFLRLWRRALITFCVMAICSALLVVLLKDARVHACPWDLAMYGGDAQWFPLFDRVSAGIQLGRCWPGGHASGGFAIVAGYFALRTQRPRWAHWILISGLTLGSVMGAVQMARGAHFLSHNLWTLWLVWAACFAIDALIQLVPLAMRYKSGALARAEPVMAKSGL